MNNVKEIVKKNIDDYNKFYSSFPLRKTIYDNYKHLNYDDIKYILTNLEIQPSEKVNNYNSNVILTNIIKNFTILTFMNNPNDIEELFNLFKKIKIHDSLKSKPQFNIDKIFFEKIIDQRYIYITLYKDGYNEKVVYDSVFKLINVEDFNTLVFKIAYKIFDFSNVIKDVISMGIYMESFGNLLNEKDSELLIKRINRRTNIDNKMYLYEIASKLENISKKDLDMINSKLVLNKFQNI